MTLDRRDVCGVVVVGINGRLLGGLAEMDEFHRFFRLLVEEHKTKVVVDLGKTNYANSPGIGMLIGAYTSIKNVGGELVLARVVDRIKSILSVTRLILIFRTFETVDEAVDYLLQKADACLNVPSHGAMRG